MVKKAGGNNLVKKFKLLLRLLMQLLVVGFQFAMLLIILYRVVPVPVTPLHIQRVFEQISNDKPITLKKSWKSIDYVTDKFSYAVLTSEDIQFPHHYGFDFEQIYKVVKRGIKSGKKMRGASTITQQTAKNLFFTPKRSWLRKLPEMGITVCLELLWTKKRILEVYINIIEMGDGVYGVEAAAQHYFNKTAATLSKKECALIAACLPNPRKFVANKPNAYIRKKADVVQRYMYRIGKLPWKGLPKNVKKAK
ncbi:MAG: monofunctional biosynthetic peptidoglycan transglycosylase [Bacteroidetes bacterium]|nr:MAG: monofunctional biosynthetic peptidoglycan transglycosylase [Bacteroidota bacterium]